MKTMQTISTGRLSNEPTLPLRVENPPVAIVANACATASNRLRPSRCSSAACSTVRPTYTVTITWTARRVRYRRCSRSCGDVSVRYSTQPGNPCVGRIASTNTMIPTPPIQCVDARQKSRARGTASTSVRMDDPVVV
jgi:hypothetical protein